MPAGVETDRREALRRSIGVRISLGSAENERRRAQRHELHVTDPANATRGEIMNTSGRGIGTTRAHFSRSEPAVSYNEFKEYEGRKYTGMKIGRSHKWYYDKGEWKETKVTPDVWEISYAVTKRRAGRAPEGSGVPVGTEYHWYVVAHQNVLKLNANDYTTSLAGLKFKIAHRRADNGKWSATPGTQRKRMIELLQGLIGELKRQTDRPATAAAENERASAPKRVARMRAVGKPKSKVARETVRVRAGRNGRRRAA
jgi:hypothetical protein